MKAQIPTILTSLLCAALLAACGGDPAPETKTTPAVAATPSPTPTPALSHAEKHLDDYVTVRLAVDVSSLSERERQLLGVMIDAAQTMDPLFWQQHYGDRAELMGRITDEPTRRFAEINYGPWDRLNGDVSFVAGIGARPPGAQFYPADMTKEQFEQAELTDKASLYTVLRRDDAGALITQPYHEAYAAGLAPAAALVREAAKLADDAGLRRYLELRAKALLDDEYQASDLAWMDMRDNRLDLVIGPIETYEDQLFGYKASYEAYVLVKDIAWSERLARYAQLLPELQRGLPVDAKYKSEMPGSDADLGAYFVAYYAGNANSGAKTIAINLPNDEQVQLQKGSRRLQLENVMQAKFDAILVPIAAETIAESQRANVTFDAFFQNVMFHEVAHGLGIKITVDGKGTVRDALKEHASAFEECKADVLGLYLVTKLAEKGEVERERLLDNYVTYVAGILRSVRFGASNSHAIANVVALNFLAQREAFTRDERGRYTVDADKMKAGIDELATMLLVIQGDGNHATAKSVIQNLGVVGPDLASDLARLEKANIPVDVVFEQGRQVLGLDAAVAAPAAPPAATPAATPADAPANRP